MTELQMFLMENPVDNITVKVRLGGRLKDFEFELKPMNNNDMSKYQKLCVKNPGSAKKKEFDVQKFNELVVINNVITPNFKDPEWMKSAGVLTPEALLNKVLLAGEIAELSEKVSEISGFGDNSEDLEDEVKN